MAQDRPTAAELVQAVREFLERDVMPATEARVQFHTRVSVNALGHDRTGADRRPGLRRRGARGRPPCSRSAMWEHPPTCAPSSARSRKGSGTDRSTIVSTRCGCTYAPPCGKSSSSRTPATFPPTRRARPLIRPSLPSDADRDVERQLLEGPAPARRGVPRIRRGRRVVPTGDEVGRQVVSRADLPVARVRIGAPRTGTVERRCDPVARGYHRPLERFRRRAPRSLRRRRARSRREPAEGSASSASTYRTGGRSPPTSTNASWAGWRACTTGSTRATPATTRSSSWATSTSHRKIETSGIRSDSWVRPT